jgi:zinc protease
VNMMPPAFHRCVQRRIIAAVLILPLFAAPALATTIERVVSPGGIEAWLVHEPAVPMIAVDFAFGGGAAQDPSGKAGTANLVASLLDEGAGDLDSKTFHARLERKAIELGFQAERDTLRGTLRTLTENRDEAFDYLRLALTKPRFEGTDVEIIRSQILSNLRRATTSPTDIASLRWWQTAFADHPYGRPVNGSLESVPTVTADDLKDYTRRVLARANLKIAVVGDIDAEAVTAMLDRVFGALPAEPDLKPVANVAPQGLGRRIVVKLDVPQAVVTFGGAGIARKDPDFMAAYIVNHILGGGAFSSRLYQEVREKRGLAYSVYDSLVWLNHSAVPRRYRDPRRPRRRDARRHRQGNPSTGRERPDRRRARQGQGLSQRLVRAQSRHLEQDRGSAGAVAARWPRHRLLHPPT